MNTPPPIPEIEDEDLRMAVSSLYNSAKTMHSAITSIVSDEDMPFIIQHSHVLMLAEVVIRHWGNYFDDENGIPDPTFS